MEHDPHEAEMQVCSHPSCVTQSSQDRCRCVMLKRGNDSHGRFCTRTFSIGCPRCWCQKDQFRPRPSPGHAPGSVQAWQAARNVAQANMPFDSSCCGGSNKVGSVRPATAFESRHGKPDSGDRQADWKPDTHKSPNHHKRYQLEVC